MYDFLKCPFFLPRLTILHKFKTVFLLSNMDEYEIRVLLYFVTVVVVVVV